jgi:hypothetical protein
MRHVIRDRPRIKKIFAGHRVVFFANYETEAKMGKNDR